MAEGLCFSFYSIVNKIIDSSKKFFFQSHKGMIVKKLSVLRG